MLKKAAVFVSGNGSNFQAILDASNDKVIPIEVVVVVCNKKDAYALVRASNAHIPVILLDYTSGSVENIEKQLVKQLKMYQVEYIFLAGFLKRLTSYVIDLYDKKIINIHPSLLPSYKGLNAIEQALHDKQEIIGVSVHYVDELLDNGSIIMQESINVKNLDHKQIYEQIHMLEHELYIKAILKVVEE